MTPTAQFIAHAVASAVLAVGMYCLGHYRAEKKGQKLIDDARASGWLEKHFDVIAHEKLRRANNGRFKSPHAKA